LFLQPGMPVVARKFARFLGVDRFVTQADAVEGLMIFQCRDDRGQEPPQQGLSFRRVEAILQKAVPFLAQVGIFVQHPPGKVVRADQEVHRHPDPGCSVQEPQRLPQWGIGGYTVGWDTLLGPNSIWMMLTP
jgi:hypothetical protein